MSSETIFKEARALPFAEQVELCRNLWDGIVGSHELAPGEAELILKTAIDRPQKSAKGA